MEHTIQQVAKLTGISVHTLRYYEKIGLLGPVDRAKNGYRSYSDTDIAWVEFLNRLRVTGMPIRKMKEFSFLRRNGDETVRERRELLEQHKRVIQADVGKLKQNLMEIERKINLYRQMEEKHDAEDGKFTF